MTKVILVIGACGLDRLLSIAAYPVADSKISTTAYHESGGGNAANTAHAMALLKDATFLKQNGFVVKLVTKVGDDSIGEQLVRELQLAGVDLTSPLFRYGRSGSTTSFTTVIVSETEFTRTCIHTPGTCGPLTLDDTNEVDMDEVFRDVVHVHSDGRFLAVSSQLAIEARRRGLSVSVDPEKDRFVAEQDDLLELATTVFLNAHQMHAYFERRTKLLETKNGRSVLPKSCFVSPTTNALMADDITSCIRPSLFYLRWYGNSQLKKDFVITKGSLGAVHIQPERYQIQDAAICRHEVEVHLDSNNNLQVDCNVIDGLIYSNCRFQIQTCGVLKNASVVDTTGAGDAFIAGYVMFALEVMRDHKTSLRAMEFGSWVAGKKLEGHGARLALPRGELVDIELGHSPSEIASSVRARLGLFGANS